MHILVSEAIQMQDMTAGRRDDSADHNEHEYDQGLLHCILEKDKQTESLVKAI